MLVFFWSVAAASDFFNVDPLAICAARQPLYVDTKKGIVKLSNTLDPLMSVPLKNVGPLLIRFKIIPTNKAVLNESIRISGDKVCFAKEVKLN